VGRYAFVSSLSVYARTSEPRQDENAPLAEMPAGASTETFNMEHYGPLKVLCERAVQAVFGGRALIMRPGLIVGPHDPTGRFTYWPRRVAEGGQVLAPGRPERVVQFIDARDLGQWMVLALERGLSGPYNLNGSERLGDVLDACRAASGSNARFTWTPDSFLLAQGVAPWQDLPLWIPESDPEMAGFFRFNCTRAVRAGLTYRSLAQTVAATLAWDSTPAGQAAARAGLTRERERELLDIYRREGKNG
jgi:2'-hydroxyisoflavone reductase